MDVELSGGKRGIVAAVNVVPLIDILINQSDVPAGGFRGKLDELFSRRARRVAFLQGDRSLEFQSVARVLDVMHAAGAVPVGLLTSELEKKR